MRQDTVRRVFVTISLLYFLVKTASGGNPIVQNVGLCDPEVRVYDNRAYLYATHDSVHAGHNFEMHDWWVWSSDDLINWKQISTLRPEETYWQKPCDQCWATNAISHKGKYYFYFSRGPTELGVVVGDTPAGPWKDTIHKPLIATNSTPTAARDPGILQEDDGTTYIIFGCWDYFIARLNDDMVSLAETPRKVEVSPRVGPYGKGKLDDKPILFKRAGKYYLSWGCYYGLSDSVYGPYTYKDSIIHKDRVEPIFQKGLTSDRHGSFFALYNQWYFICNDQSWPGTSPHYRDSVVSYVHFRNNSEIEPVFLNTIGVGQYDAKDGIDAANYFSGIGVTQKQRSDGKFEVQSIADGTALVYPKVMNLPANAKMSLTLSCGNPDASTIEIHSGSDDGTLLGKIDVVGNTGWNDERVLACSLKNVAGQIDLHLVFRGKGNDLLHLCRIAFQ